MSNCFVETFKKWMERECKDPVTGEERAPCCQVRQSCYRREREGEGEKGRDKREGGGESDSFQGREERETSVMERERERVTEEEGRRKNGGKEMRDLRRRKEKG